MAKVEKRSGGGGDAMLFWRSPEPTAGCRRSQQPANVSVKGSGVEPARRHGDARCSSPSDRRSSLAGSSLTAAACDDSVAAAATSRRVFMPSSLPFELREDAATSGGERRRAATCGDKCSRDLSERISRRRLIGYMTPSFSLFVFRRNGLLGDPSGALVKVPTAKGTTSLHAVFLNRETARASTGEFHPGRVQEGNTSVQLLINRYCQSRQPIDVDDDVLGPSMI